jgi:hypothetical protein
MKKLTLRICCLMILLTISLTLFSQEEVESYFGPRIGGTLITGQLADKLKTDYKANPFVTQFGWQFEYRFFTTQKGVTGIVELIPLVGGVEQNLFLPSFSSLVGMRSKKGFEFGIGPNASVTGFGVVFAVGCSIKTNEINWPINFVIFPSTEGMRYTILLGFNISSK